MHIHSRPDRVEALAPLLLLYIFGLAYNEIGELAATRGVDYGPVIETALDRRVPFIPAFIVPYSLFWPYPLIVFVYLYAKLGWEPMPYRRLFAGLLVLIVACIALWIWFPVRVDVRATEEVLAARGLPAALVSLTYYAATPWNACPSFHVAGAWFLYRAVRFYVVRATPLLPILAGLIIASTVLIRIHYLLDIVFGLAIGELVFGLVLRRLEAAKAFSSTPAPTARAGEAAILLAGVAAYVVLLTG